MTVKKWNEEERGPMTFERLKEIFPLENKYLVRWGRDEPEVKTQGMGPRTRHGWRWAGTIYVLAGTCEMKVGGTTLTVGPGEYADFPEGDYFIEFTGDIFEYVYVWKIP